MAALDAARILTESLSEAINIAASLRSGHAPTPELLQELLVAADTFHRAYTDAVDSKSELHSGELDLERIARILDALRTALYNQGSHLVFDEHVSDLAGQFVSAFPPIGAP